MSTSITIPRGSPSSRYLTETHIQTQTQTQLPVVISHNKRWLRVLNLLYYCALFIYLEWININDDSDVIILYYIY